MRIALITAFPPSRHALNEYGYHVASQLRQQQGIDLTVLGDYLVEPAEELPGFKVVRCWGFSRGDSALSLFRTVWREKPDVAWFNLGFASFGNRPLSAAMGLITPAAVRLRGVYSHVTLHQLFETVDLEDAAVAWPRLYRLGGWLTTHMLLSANSLSVLLPAYRRILNEKYRRGRVSARAHGIFADRPEPPNLSRRGNPIHLILAFGKWGTYKRLDVLIKAFNRFIEEVPNAKLVVGGGDHPQATGYIESMTQRYAGESISFLGYVPENAVADLFRAASLVVMPYTSSAGSSGVAHLAAQYGVPVIASDIHDFRELAAEEGIAIQFFAAGSADSLFEQMVLLLGSSEKLKAMAWQNYAAGVAMSMPTVVREYLHSFRQSERIKTLQMAARLRRSRQLARLENQARSVGEKIQRWTDEDGTFSSG